MSQVVLVIDKVELKVLEGCTECKLFYRSSDPYHPQWGGGWKVKDFSLEYSMLDILRTISLSAYVEWDDYLPDIEYNLN